MEVENVTGVSLTTRRTTEEKRHLTVSNSLLGKIIIEDHSVLAIVTEEFSHSSSGVGSKELKRGRVGSSSSNNDAVTHGTLLIKLSYKLGDGGSLLSNTNVDACKGVGLGLLVDNCVNSNGGLSGLTITNDKLTLSKSNGDKGIYGLKAGKHGLGNGLTGDNSGGLNLSTRTSAGIKGSTSINGLTNSVDNTSKKLLTNRNIHNSSSTLDGVSLKNITIVTEDHNSDVVLLQVKGHTAETAGEDNHLSGLDIGKTVNTGDTVSNGNYRTSLGELDGAVLVTTGGADLGLKVS
mmetsp:Transcript_17320/g.24659  ORF Transcript_17320/g.24659 Transcript_17320/m.24659 type:complete len:292 (+) Transcript_17320:580-1455(+)